MAFLEAHEHDIRSQAEIPSRIMPESEAASHELDLTGTASPLEKEEPPSFPEFTSGGWQATKLLGQGGMGSVFHAEAPIIGFNGKPMEDDDGAPLTREAAIKVLRPSPKKKEKMSAEARLRVEKEEKEIKARFKREAEALAALKSPWIVPLYDIVETTEGETGIVMRYVKDGNLGEWMKEMRAKGLEREELEELVVSLGIQICLGLSESHNLGLVHRDLKPGNILVNKKLCQAMITDFGLVRFVREMQHVGMIESTQEEGGLEETAEKISQFGLVVGNF